MEYKFDVAISFAGENRAFAEAVAKALRKEGLEVFYDGFYESDMWGENLPDIFKNVFGKNSRYCIMILSNHYIEKEWPALEREHAVERFIKQRGEAYILPVRLDGFEGEVPGLPSIRGYISAKSTESEKVANAFLEKQTGSRILSLLERPVSDREEETELPIPRLGNETNEQHGISLVKEHKRPRQKHEADTEKEYSPSTQGVQSKSPVPAELVDREIEKEVERLRRARFYKEFKAVRASVNLAEKLVEGELSGGTDIARSHALAWCVRVLSLAEELKNDAEKHLDAARDLKPCEATAIAEAFISSRKGEKEAALNILNEIASPMAKSAALMIVANHESEQAAIDWLKTRGNVSNLDPEGKFFLVIYKLNLALWDSARDCLNAFTDEDLRKFPELHHVAAITHLLSAVPRELRKTLYERPPLEEAEFQLVSDADAVRERRKAREHFVEAMEAARELDFPGTANICEEYALWLELSDPKKSNEARKQLETRFLHPETALHLVRLAARFGIDFDPQAVEREIERQVADNGEVTYEAARTRFALVFTKNNLREVADYVERHQEELAGCSDKKSVQVFKIRMLSEAGEHERAKKCLAVLKEEGLSEPEYEEIRGTIVEAEQGDRIETVKQRFERTGSLRDLIILVNELGAESRWEEVSEYGRTLFERTRSLFDAERLANAFSKTRQTVRLVEFVEANKDLLEQSKYLRMIHCWALYTEGDLLEARSRFKELDRDPDNDDYRALRIKLAVSTGDWNELSSFVNDEFSEKDNRTAQDLISVAQLAAQVDMASTAKDLTFAATEKGNEDPEVLGTAYFLAMNAGWDDDPKVQGWLEKALELSSDDGPVRRFSLRSFLDLKPELDQETSDTRKKLISGEIPMFAAGWLLDKSLFDLMLLPALANLSEDDPRRRVAVPAYSGSRPPMRLDTGGTVGIDATALVTLNFLGLLGKALDVFSEVCIPHSTLSWLFDEKRRAGFHQPSQARDARKVRDLLATDKLEKLAESSTPDGDLSARVGDELATLIAEAEKSEENENAQRIVVRPAPVYLLASLMGEEADLAAHAGVLCNCMSVIRTLRQKGSITAEEESRASDYLRVREKPWPEEPEIEDGATLYLDDMALNFFLRLGMLEKLRGAGFRPFISAKAVSRTDAFLFHESIFGEVGVAVENIRDTLNSRIKSEEVKTARQINGDERTGMQLHEHPTAGIFAMAGNCDAIVVDDRFVNKNAGINMGDDDAPVFSTLDVLDTLLSSRSITQEKWRECRTRLRRAGYFFVPVTSEELQHHLGASVVKNGKVVEVPELKAVRENILCVQMNECLQFPKEWTFLNMCLASFVQAIRGQWTGDADAGAARIRSDWVIERTNVKGWIQHLGHKKRNDMANTEFGMQVMTMLLPPTDEPTQVEGMYWEWFEDRILSMIKERYPGLYDRIVQWYRRESSSYAEAYMAAAKAEKNDRLNKAALAKEALDIVPPLLRNTLLADRTFLEEYEVEADSLVSLENPVAAFRGSELFAAVRKVLSGAPGEEVTDTDGSRWELKNAGGKDRPPSLVLSLDDKQFPVSPNFVSLSPDAATRLRFLEKTASDLNLPSEATNAWREILKDRALKDDELRKLDADFLDTSSRMEQFVNRELAGGRVGPASLIPSSRRYFERLVGKCDGSATVSGYVAGSGGAFLREMFEREPYKGFLSSLFLSSHPALSGEIKTDGLDKDDFVRACEFLEKRGDRLSQLGAVEAGLRVLASTPGIEPHIVRLVRRIRDDGSDGDARGFKLFSALLLLADGELSRLRLFSSEPPFYRRLAAVSHAALLHRQLASSGIDADRFYSVAVASHGWNHWLQSLVDKRLEPLWNPLCWVETPMKSIFLARIVAATKKCAVAARDEELFNLVSGMEPEGVGRAHGFFAHSTSLLDGGEEHLRDLPDEISEIIRTQVGDTDSAGTSFTALMNSVWWFRVDSDHVDSATEVIRRNGGLLPNVENKQQLFQTLEGLALVAAATRNRALADELRTVSRRYGNYAQYGFSAKEETVICLLAAASRAGLKDWTEFVGDWVTEIAFRDLENHETEGLRSDLRYLCHIVRDLWATCGRAHAALTGR